MAAVTEEAGERPGQGATEDCAAVSGRHGAAACFAWARAAAAGRERRVAERCEMSRGQATGWKVLAAGMAVLAGLCLAAGAMGAEIRNVTAKQRYPWNGLVDIRFTVSGIGEGEAWPLSVAAVEPDSGSVRELSNYWVVRDGTNSSDRAVSANGECEV